MKLVIIGGVAGGASAAARARRISEDAEIIVLERGTYVSFANCGLPYHIGGVIADRDRLLVQTPESLKARFNIDVRVRNEVARIDRQRKTVAVRDLAKGGEYEISYDALILSPGAEPIRPPLPGIDLPRVLTLRSLEDMDAIKKAADAVAGQRAIIVGGGYIGLEMAEALRERKLAVTIVELTHQVMGPLDIEMVSPLHQELRRNGVDLRLGTSVKGFEAKESGLDALLSTGEVMSCGLAILAIGVKPDARLAREAGLAIGDRGGIVVDEHMRTGDPSIFAVGDAVEVPDFVGGFPTFIPLAGPANRQGRIAADNALGRSPVYKKTQGTGICKVFSLAAGMTGLNEKALKRAGIPYEKVYVHPASHASYYPGAHQMTLKLLFSPKGGAILGAQAVGADGVDKRIDVLAVALRAGLTVYDLEDLELCYAPPYGSAKDPVNYAGFVAANALRGDAALCHAADVVKPRADQFLLDVRTPGEVHMGTIPGAVNIPIDALRSRLAEVPKEKEILAFCQVGLRGYLACRILSQRGYSCRNLSGGYKTYRMAIDQAPKGEAPGSEMKSDAEEPGETQEGASCRGPAPAAVTIARQVDASGLQCPGPIMKLNEALAAVKPGESVSITVTDPGFEADIPAWCASTGNRLVEVCRENKALRAIVEKTAGAGSAVCPSTPQCKQKTIVVFSNDLDRAMAAFIIANGAAAMGSAVTLFFTFWGLNILRRDAAMPVRKTFMERMFGMMMPRGARKLILSKMNMLGMGTMMMKGIMNQKHVATLPELIDSARKAGVRFVACTMSMDVMGIKKEELIDGVEEGGVAMYLGAAEQGSVNLFI